MDIDDMAYDRNKPYNNLPKLPPSKEVEDLEILKKLVTASRALAAANSNARRLPNPYMLINTIALQEAKTSTEIENIFTTEDDLYKAVSDTVNEEEANPGTKEVLRYREALWQGYELLDKKKKLDMDCILGVFRKVKNSNAGLRPPQSQTNIKRGQSEFRSGEVVYTPPRGAEVLEGLLNNLLEYLNDDKKYPVDPLLKMCVAHYQFEAIHPFTDGNGRTGRILNLLYLAHKKLLDQPVLYLSKYIIINKEDYYYYLGTVTQRNAWKPWILYMLNAVESTATLTSQLINDILVQMEATLEHGRKHIKWYNKEINEMIFSQPYIRQKSISDLLGISSRTTLSKYFKELNQAGILYPNKDGNGIYYVNQDLINILER